MPKLRSPQLPSQTSKVLNYLEWILLGITLIASVSPFSLGRGRPQNLPFGFIPLHPGNVASPQFPIIISLGSVACIVLLWWLGRRSSRPGSPAAMLQVIAGFGLCWLAILLSGRGRLLFPPLLLIVVLRGCLLFRWPGRIVIASGAFCSFLLMQVLALKRIEPLDIPLTRLPKLPRGVPRAFVESWQLNSVINTSLLFALVLAFILLMVGALLSEKESRDRLAQAHQKLRRYALLAEDQATLQERNRIAREMHDTVGHSLTAQSIQLENVAALMQRDLPQAKARLEKARQLGREALKNVRQTVASLRSDPLGGQPLPIALHKLANEFQQHTQIAIALQGDLAPPHRLSNPSPEIKTALYRIVQEGLTNIAKHSQATTVTLDLQQVSGGLCLILSDNGVGFDPTQNTTGFGLQSIAERVRAIGGQFKLNSQPDHGTQITIQVNDLG